MFLKLISTIIQGMVLLFILQVGYRALVPKVIRRSISFLFKQIGLLFTKLVFPVVNIVFRSIARGCSSTIELIKLNFSEEDSEDKQEVQYAEGNGRDNVIPFRSKQSKSTGA